MSDSFQSIAYDRIRQDIICCRIAPRQKLSAKGLETTLGLGRTPVREALVRLGQQGLVHTVPQSGTYVSRISMRSAESARFAREHIEKRIATGAAAIIDDQGKVCLEDIIKQQEAAVASHDDLAFFHLDNRFHEELFRLTERHDIWMWLDASNTDLERFRWLRTQVSDLDWNTILEQHHKMLDAICARNPEEAGFLTGVHLHLMTDEQEAVLAAFPDYFEQ